jgi:hypothetical protein
LTNGGVRHQTPAGIFANAPFLRHLKKLGVRVVLFERSNGLAEMISSSNTMRADNSNIGNQRSQKGPPTAARTVQGSFLRQQHIEWIRHGTHVPC